jgi:hypothetical protein
MIVKKRKEKECICLSCHKDFVISQMQKLTCNHRFCRPCMKAFVTLKVQANEYYGLSCPYMECDNSISNANILEAIKDNIGLVDKYELLKAVSKKKQ